MREVKNKSSLSFFEILDLLNDDDELNLTKANAWKKHPEKMPEEVKNGLDKCVFLSKATSKIYGSTIDPTGNVITKKALCMKGLSREKF